MRLQVVGLGAIGQRHVRNLRGLLGDQVELVAVRSRGLGRVLSDALTMESAEGVCERYDIRAFRTLEEGLAAKPEAVLVCNPTSLHLETALAAARAGCDLFVHYRSSADAAYAEAATRAH